MHNDLLFLLKRHKSFVIPFLIFVIAGALLQVFFEKGALFLLINKNYNSFWDGFFSGYTWLGDGITVLATALVFCFIKFRYSALTLLSYLYTAAVAQVLKYLFNSPRPIKYFEGGEAIRTIEGLTVHSWKSFPSGHSVTAFAFAVVLTYLLPARWGWMIFLIFLPVSLSRVYLAQHFFQDVYVGSIIGAVLTFHLISWLENQKWFKSPKMDRRLFGKSGL